MKKSKMAKFALMPAFAVSLIACGGKPSVTELVVETASKNYYVGYEFKKSDLNVNAKFSDSSTKEINDYTIEPNLPYTFVDDDVSKGKDFNITYGGKTAQIHVNVLSKPSEDEVMIKFVNSDSTVLETKKVKKGEEISYTGELPKKKDQNTDSINIFVGWDKELSIATEDATFTAIYKTLNKIIDKDHDGIPEGIDTDDNNNYFEVGAKSFVYLDQNITINFNKFLKNSNTEYDNEIAKLGLFLSNPKIDFKDGLFQDKVYGGRENAMYARLGCDEFKHFDFKDDAKSYIYDKFDSTSGCVAHKYLYNDDGTIAKDLIIIAFEGTNGPNRWASNFDVGYNDANYYNKTGGQSAHPEWDKKEYHKGFYVAARRVLTEKIDGDTKDGPVQFLKYIEEHSSKSNGKPIVFVTGHSRGGAMANIVGDYLEREYKDGDTPKCIPFTYTFASPATWGTNSVPETSTIFNVINKDDLVTKVPFSEWGFSRIGNNIIEKSVQKEYKALYDENRDKREYQCIDSDQIESIFHNIGCKGRDEIYNFDLTGGDENRYLSTFALNEESYDTEAAANSAKEEMQKEYEKEFGDFFKFVQLKVIKKSSLLSGEDYYDIHANCCLGTITALVQNIMVKDEKVITNILDLLPLMNNSYFVEFIGQLLFHIFPEGTDKIGLPHDYGAYHIILREYKAQ